MATTELLAAIKSRRNLEKYADLARVLHVSRQGIYSYRCKASFFDDYLCLRVAEILRIDAGAVIAAVHAERASCPEVQQVWLDVSECCDGGKTLRIIETWREKETITRKRSPDLQTI